MHQRQTQQQKEQLLSSSTYRGGAISGTAIKTSSSPINTGTKCPATTSATILASLYGSGGVIYILLKAIKRVLPIALEPFQGGSVQPLSTLQLGAYILTCIWFAYVEGYKGFQQKFSPLVVKRSFTLIPGKNNTKWYHYLLAPLYSMGLIHATKKRLIVSWSVSTGVALIVAAVKRLPYPYRNIIDAGVVAGLSWGSISIVVLYIKSWMTGTPPTADANLPESK